MSVGFFSKEVRFALKAVISGRGWIVR